MKLPGLLRRKAGAEPDVYGNDIREASYVVVDTELTGLDPKRDSIVSMGAIKMEGAEIQLGESFYRAVKPETRFTPESVMVHSITPSDVELMPSADDVIGEFLDFCEGSVLVGHFLSLDLAFLDRVMRRVLKRGFRRPAVDTFRLNEWIKRHNGRFSAYVIRDDEGTDLFSIAKKHKIQVAGAHNALTDAFITAQLFQRFLGFLPELGVKTVRDLARIGKP